MTRGKTVSGVLAAYRAQRALRGTCAALRLDIVDQVLRVDDTSGHGTVRVAADLGMT